MHAGVQQGMFQIGELWSITFTAGKERHHLQVAHTGNDLIHLFVCICSPLVRLVYWQLMHSKSMSLQRRAVNWNRCLRFQLPGRFVGAINLILIPPGFEMEKPPDACYSCLFFFSFFFFGKKLRKCQSSWRMNRFAHHHPSAVTACRARSQQFIIAKTTWESRNRHNINMQISIHNATWKSAKHVLYCSKNEGYILSPFSC